MKSMLWWFATKESNMKYIEEMIDCIYNILKFTLIGFIASILIFSSHRYYSHFVNLYSSTIVSKTEDNRLSYEYLKSVTVYLVHKMGLDEETGKTKMAIGTGTIVKLKDNNFYILTNKHVCGNETNDNDVFIKDKEHCYIAPTSDPTNAFLRLTYVLSAKYGVDLELWKIDSALLPDKQVVKGFNIAKIQDKVYTIGHYLSIPFIYSEGTMAGYEFGSELYNLPCASGCSGSGIFNENGEIVSILNAGNRIGYFQVDTAKSIGVSGKSIAEFLGE